MLSIKDFEQIYHDFFSQLVRIAYQFTFDMEASEDLCQEAFIRFYRHLERFPTHDDAKFWLIRVVKNLGINFYRKREKEQKKMERIQKMPQKQMKDGETLLLEKEMSSQVKKALEQIPENLRQTLILKEYSGMSYNEIAKAMNLTLSNVKIRIFRARALLAQLLNTEESYALSE